MQPTSPAPGTVLWNAITAFQLNDPKADYTFSARLAHENYWTINFTEAAILEYKKFMYLAAVSDEMVSPSEIIDAVWHQHLVYTQSYNQFCEVLDKQVQHLPSARTRKDQQKFSIAKEHTQQLYREHFGEPPAAIWNYPDMFASLHLPKAKYKLRSIVILGLLAFALLTIPFYFLLKPLYINIDNPYFLIGYTVLVVVTLFLLEMLNRTSLTKLVTQLPANSFVYSLHPYELICLKTQSIDMVVHATMDELFRSNSVVGYRDNSVELAGAGIEASSHVQQQVINTLNEMGRIQYPKLLKILRSRPVFSNITQSMQALKKYFTRSKDFAKLFYINFTVLSMVLMLGFTRFATGLLREREVTYILIAILVTLFIAATYLYRLTRFIGANVIAPRYMNKTVTTEDQHDPAWQYFFYGTAALLPAFVPLVTYTRQNQYAGDGGSGSSDGGGSCGSSCGGGCGGCGGGS